MTSVFRLCRVLDMRDGTPPTVHVHFEGVPFVADEFVPFDSNRLAPFESSQGVSSPKHGLSSKQILVASSKFVTVGDYVEVRMFSKDAQDFRFQMAQIVSSDSTDGSIRVHFEGLLGVEDEIINISDIPLRVRCMGIGISSLSPEKKTKKKKKKKEKKSSRRRHDEDDDDDDDGKSNVISSATTTATPTATTTATTTTAAAPATYSQSNQGDEESSSSSLSSGSEHDEDEDDDVDEDDMKDTVSGLMNKKKKKKKTSSIQRMKSSKSDLSKALKKMGLRIIKIAADGNCLFRAVAHQLYVDVSRHSELRSECCLYLVKHRQHFENFVDGDFDEYIKKMKMETTWGGNLEIIAMSELCDRKILIHSKDDVKEMKERLNEEKIKRKTMVMTTSMKTRMEKEKGSNGGSSNGGKGGTKEEKERTVPASVLKHDFETSASVATPRPKDVQAPNPIQLSYHGQSHYNSVVDPNIPLPLPPLGTSYISQGRILREKDEKRIGNDGGGSGGGGETTTTDQKKSTTKSSTKKKRAFFRFPGGNKKKNIAAPPSDPPPTTTTTTTTTTMTRMTTGKREINPTSTTPRSLAPMKSSPNLSNLDDASPSTLVLDGRAKGRQERQRPSLPALPSHAGSGDGAAQNAGAAANNLSKVISRSTIPQVSMATQQRGRGSSKEPSPRPDLQFMKKADALLKSNMDKLDARLANKMRREKETEEEDK